jgi:hypothetical protein
MQQTGPEFIRTLDTNVGKMDVIVTERQNRPAGLRKPYEYILPRKEAEAKYKAIFTYLRSQSQRKFQFASASKRGLSRGMKMNIFLLGYEPGATGDGTGCTAEEWNELTGKTQAMVHDMLGPDARMYIDPHRSKDKFQARIETYIAFREML